MLCGDELELRWRSVGHVYIMLVRLLVLGVMCILMGSSFGAVILFIL